LHCSPAIPFCLYWEKYNKFSKCLFTEKEVPESSQKTTFSKILYFQKKEKEGIRGKERLVTFFLNEKESCFLVPVSAISTESDPFNASVDSSQSRATTSITTNTISTYEKHGHHQEFSMRRISSLPSLSFYFFLSPSLSFSLLPLALSSRNFFREKEKDATLSKHNKT